MYEFSSKPSSITKAASLAAAAAFRNLMYRVHLWFALSASFYQQLITSFPEIVPVRRPTLRWRRCLFPIFYGRRWLPYRYQILELD